MSKLIRFLALVASVGLIAAVAPVASATHPQTDHEDMPEKQVPAENAEVLAICAVLGQVTTIDGPKGDTESPDHSHYEFRQTDLDCVSESQNWTRTFDVRAWGGADGPDQPDPDNPGALKHGSTTALSYSHSSGYEHAAECGANITNKNNITASSPNPLPEKSGKGWVKFIRVGPDAEAWGQFCTGALAPLKFTAELVFTPVVPPVNNLFDLRGTAVIFCGDFEPDKDGKNTKTEPCPSKP